MVERSKNADVIVIGAGITGMSIAWHLGVSGIRCLVIDRDEVGSGMTSVQAGGVRTQWSSRLTCRLALESRRFYEQIEEHLSPRTSPGLEASGCAFVARTENTLETIRGRVNVQRDVGVQARMAEPAELADLLPALRPDTIVGGAFNPVDGYFRRPMAVVDAFAEAASRCGQSLRRATVQRLIPSADQWRVELSDGSSVTASDVVVATGCAAAELLADVEVRIPLRRQPRYLFGTAPVAQRILPSLVIFQDDSLVAKQLADGRFFGSDLRYGLDGIQPGQHAFERMEQGLRQFLSLPEGVHFTWAVEGEYDVTPDHQFLTGPVPDRPGLWMAAGLQGRGMMLAPSVGRMMAEAMGVGWARSAEAIPGELMPARFGAGWNSDFEALVI